MTLDLVRVQREDPIAWVTLNRPEKRNALNPELIDSLVRVLDALAAQDEVRVVILTGEGKAFCSGLDLAALRAASGASFEESLEDSQRYARLLKQIYLCPKPVIAAVNGAAIAGGCGLVSVCDFSIAAATARLGYTEGRIGFVAAIVSYFLIRSVGERVARDLLLTARLVEPQEALQMGLVNEVVEDSSLARRVRELAQQLCASSPHSLQANKALLARFASPDLDTALDYACQLNARFRSSEDCVEGVAAFLEKRLPRWISH